MAEITPEKQRWCLEQKIRTSESNPSSATDKRQIHVPFVLTFPICNGNNTDISDSKGTIACAFQSHFEMVQLGEISTRGQSATGVSKVCDVCPKLTLPDLTLHTSDPLSHLYYKTSYDLGELFIKYATLKLKDFQGSACIKITAYRRCELT